VWWSRETRDAVELVSRWPKPPTSQPRGLRCAGPGRTCLSATVPKHRVGRAPNSIPDADTSAPGSNPFSFVASLDRSVCSSFAGADAPNGREGETETETIKWSVPGRSIASLGEKGCARVCGVCDGVHIWVSMMAPCYAPTHVFM
jgi:hypothetical protein